MRAMIERISSATSVVPKGCLTLDADNSIVTNRMFSGLDYPDKLESFLHKLSGPAGTGRGWAASNSKRTESFVCTVVQILRAVVAM